MVIGIYAKMVIIGFGMLGFGMRFVLLIKAIIISLLNVSGFCRYMEKKSQKWHYSRPISPKCPHAVIMPKLDISSWTLVFSLNYR
jgi:hypothetical protein